MKNNALKMIIVLAMTAGVALLSGCKSRAETSGLQNISYIGSEEESSMQNVYSDSETEKSESVVQSSPNSTVDNMETNEIYIKTGEHTLTAILEDNESAAALKELIADKPLTVSASNYGGFEKVCALGTNLPRNDVQTTTQAGDICLYNGNQIVIFYGSNSWSYTRLGKILNANSSELEKILGGNETELTLSLKPFD